MLKHGIAVIELRTVSVLQEARQIVIQCVARLGGTMESEYSRFDEALQKIRFYPIKVSHKLHAHPVLHHDTR